MGNDGEHGTVRVIDTESGFTARIEGTHAMATEVNRAFWKVRYFSVEIKRKPARFPARLIRNSVRTDPSRNGGVQAHASGKPAVVVGVGGRRLCGRLANLNFHPFAVTQQSELTGGLEVVLLPIDRMDMRVSMIGARIGSADLPP